MKCEGILNLKENKVKRLLDYTTVDGGRFINLSEELNLSLMDVVEVRVKKNGNVLFNEKGKLYLVPHGATFRPSTCTFHKNQNSDKYIWDYYVDNENLSEILWNNVDSKLTIEIRRNEVKDNGTEKTA